MELMTRKDWVSLTELAEQYSDEFPEYIIQSWMRSCNTLEFLRQWGNNINAEFDDRACEELIHQGQQHRSPLRHLCGFEGLMPLECI